MVRNHRLASQGASRWYVPLDSRWTVPVNFQPVGIRAPLHGRLPVNLPCDRNRQRKSSADPFPTQTNLIQVCW